MSLRGLLGLRLVYPAKEQDRLLVRLGGGGGGNGAVMTIGSVGGSGDVCKPAAHGIGITEADEASFVHDQHGDVLAVEDEYDYGNGAWAISSSTLPTYALNMWVR